MMYQVKDILKMLVAPALGCTEPVAIALSAAAAASLLPDRNIDRIEIWVDPNIYKNGTAVAIPGAPGLSGLDTAAALGALGGEPGLKLEVLAGVDEALAARAQDFIRQNRVKVNLLDSHRGLHIRTEVRSGDSVAEAVVTKRHDNIERLTLDGRDLPDHPLVSPPQGEAPADVEAMEAWLKGLSLEQLLEMVDELDEEDLEFMDRGVEYNLRLAEYGLKFGPGLGVGKALDRLVRQKLIKKDMILAARILTSAAADARMSGAKLPAMSSAGSGNHGLTAVLPIWAIKDYIVCGDRDVLQALGLSHILTGYVKAHTGRLSAVCGCSIAAGAGAAAGITFLMGGDLQHMAGAVKNLTEDLAGVICDGAKAGCAFKLATAAGTAVQAALFALQGINVRDTGIIGSTLEQTTQNIGTLSNEGMIETDRTILRIMLEKHFKPA